MSVLETALRFAEKGYHVFPLYKGKNGAKLKVYGWAKNETVDPSKADKVVPATNDIEYINSWPEIIKEKYNSTVAGFGVLGLDCVIIDVDVKNGKDGITQMKKLMAAHNVAGTPMFVTTKSGGLHLYYRRPESFLSQHIKSVSGISINSVKYDGIDVRGNSGFVVGPEHFISSTGEAISGSYCIVNLLAPHELPEFPASILENWTRSTFAGDMDNMMFDAPDADDYKSQIRRGIIPDVIPKGARNEAFYLFINVLKSKNIPVEVAKQMCLQMATKCEDRDDLFESVNIDEMLARVYVINQENPYDIAVDLINNGMFQLTNYKSKIHYVILENNPYIASRTPHDEGTMKTLLTKFQKSVQGANGKDKIINPLEVVNRIIHDENRADTLGFKPNAGQVFTLHDDPGARRFLNTYQPVIIPASSAGVDDTIWDEFKLVVSRIFGPEGSEEYQLGLDFVAWLVQKPHMKPSIAPFIMSHQRGVGKSLFFNLVIHILGTSKEGERQGRLTKLDEIAGRFFNPAGCVLNLLDEVQFPMHKDTRKEAVTFWRHLKNIITAETIPIEIKGGATYQVPNSAALILAGNTGSHFPIEEMDRRLWIIDANPPLLERGVVDRLFMIIKGYGIGPDERQRLVGSLRYHLYHHKIVNDLSSLRAPMNDIKREMFLNSLTDIEEWMISHFENEDALLAASPVITKSAFIYVAETSDKLMGSKYREDTDALFRDLKRRGLLRPIRAKTSSNISRNMEMPIIGSDGQVYSSQVREVVYTTRDHGSFDRADNKEIMHAYMRNVHTIKYFKGKIKAEKNKSIYDEATAMTS